MEHGMTAAWQTSSSMAAGKAAAACAHLIIITDTREDEEGSASEAITSVRGDAVLRGPELVE